MPELTRPRFETAADVFGRRFDRASNTRYTGFWTAGTLAGLERPTVAVVGTRAPSDAAAARAHALGAALARAGVCVVSGLALGIDAAAHAGALAGGGPTVGVLGGGHRKFYPRRNRGLALGMLAAGGAVLSPFAPDEPVRRAQFIQRNAVLAGLADVVVVVEAAERSGALNTAGWAADLGLDVLAYPGDVDRPKAAGCNALIRDGAVLVRGPDDVFEALGLRVEAEFAEPPVDVATLSPLERRIVAALAGGPCDGEAIAHAASASPAQLAATLVTLEIAGAIVREPSSARYALPDAGRSLSGKRSRIS